MNNSFIVLAHALCKFVITLPLSPKNVIDTVQSEGNLNQNQSLRMKMTIIGNGHTGI